MAKGRKKQNKRRRGFTLVELLVVVAIISLLISILMPSLAQVRVVANKMVCGTHLSDIGKAMIMYSDVNRDRFPTAGVDNYISRTGRINKWDAKYRKDAFAAGGATISSSFYLLVKYGNMVPKQFVCEGDVDAKPFEISTETTTITDLKDAWDFGEKPGIHVSYSYNAPYSSSPLTTSSPAGSPVCADRNPYLDKNTVDWIDGANPNLAKPTLEKGIYQDPDQTGNSAAHQRNAQNVLYIDGHVKSESSPNVGNFKDNIWRYWGSNNTTQEVIQVGGLSPNKKDLNVIKINSPDDACLINDWNEY